MEHIFYLKSQMQLTIVFSSPVEIYDGLAFTSRISIKQDVVGALKLT
jgi:hypothetical protein